MLHILRLGRASTCTIPTLMKNSSRFTSTTINAEDKTETAQAVSTITRSGSIDWSFIDKTGADHLANQKITSTITSAIIPWKQQWLTQKFLAPITYANMYYLEFLVVPMQLPWWAAIISFAVTLKVVMFPLNVQAQIITVKTQNLMPITQPLTVRANDAMVEGDKQTHAIISMKLNKIYNENDLGLRKRLTPLLLQAPLFMGSFCLLRNLTEINETMRTDGCLWFQDLSAPDPLYILPLSTCALLFAQLQYNMSHENTLGGMSNTALPIFKWFSRLLPIGLFFLLQSFPAGMTLFWTVNNFVTLMISYILRRPIVSKVFKIPLREKLNPESLPLSNQSFSDQVKTAVATSKSQRSSFELRRLDDLSFRKAGVGPIRKTYLEKDCPKFNSGRVDGS